ncbi:LAMI_0H12904g1_1 [Lachancea mirantina]|uniref:Succinate-semialdehyde dehydrogenase, mitochondrial n=1 Tax=Lachancea mirantina TaxID=1230905 RepID=A0A1G4KHS0_9SACH|nr:LAMI_0H12904g1_1 [Lachancea mirantina]
MLKAGKCWHFGIIKRSISSSFRDSSVFKSEAYFCGEWKKGDETFCLRNPATQDEISSITDCGISDYNEAIKGAHGAFKSFRKSAPSSRSEALQNIYELMQENKEDLARLVTMENGKPYRESLAEVDYASSYFKWFSEEAHRMVGTIMPGSGSTEKKILTIRRPLGVVGILTPWNFPTAMIARKLAPALAAGNTCVVKPAQETPLSALAYGWLCEQAGFESGVCNILPTSHADVVGKYMCQHDLVSKITFTGSTKVGRILMQHVHNKTGTIKKVSMELGGNAPFIIFEDADIYKALDGIMASKFRNSGQTCICANRIFVHESLYDTVASSLAKRMETDLVMGSGFDVHVTQGPLINDKAVNKVSDLVEDAKNKGAKVLMGGTRASTLGRNFYHPTILTDVDESMDVFHKEIFGPVACLIKFKTTEEVLRRSNDSNVGLAGYFYTANIGTIMKLAEDLEVGMIGVNSSEISDAVLPFGGVKDSGLGREGSLYGINDYTELKSIILEP